MDTGESTAMVEEKKLADAVLDGRDVEGYSAIASTRAAADAMGYVDRPSFGWDSWRWEDEWCGRGSWCDEEAKKRSEAM